MKKKTLSVFLIITLRTGILVFPCCDILEFPNSNLPDMSGYARQRTINCTCYGNYRIITCFYLLRYFCYIPWCRMWSRNMRSEPQCFKQCEHWKLSSSRKRKQYSIMSSYHELWFNFILFPISFCFKLF